ncbi:hypothetical protein LTR94_031595, partial [Friedmanniomyces endolithicus]
DVDAHCMFDRCRGFDRDRRAGCAGADLYRPAPAIGAAAGCPGDQAVQGDDGGAEDPLVVGGAAQSRLHAVGHDHVERDRFAAARAARHRRCADLPQLPAAQLDREGEGHRRRRRLGGGAVADRSAAGDPAHHRPGALGLPERQAAHDADRRLRHQRRGARRSLFREGLCEAAADDLSAGQWPVRGVGREG